MSYIVEYRDEQEYEDVISKMHKAKKAVCEAMEALEESGVDFGERNMGYRRGMSSYRGDDYDGYSERMGMRYGRYRY